MRFDLGPDLAAAREAALAAVDKLARLRADALGGETPAHAAKREEAERMIREAALREPDPSDYPMLDAEIGITAASLIEVAGVVHSRAAAWRKALAVIEAERLAAKAAIRAATSHLAIRATARDLGLADASRADATPTL